MGWYCSRCGQQAVHAGACPRDGEALSPVSGHDFLGRTLGEYTVLAVLGGGAFGSVYRAIHPRSGMVVAIKLMHRPVGDAESQRVVVEARAAAMLNHPNVVKVYDLAIAADRRPYLVMQYLHGQSLARIIEYPVTVQFAVSLACDVLAGLSAAHKSGIIHRDLKPDNVFVVSGHAVIVDFGLAKLIADPRSPSLTVTGEAIGTPHYMAPEQIRAKPADGRADVYAVGCVLFEMLAGRPPFLGDAAFMLFDAHLNHKAPSIVTLRADVPANVADAIARALEKDPDARFADAEAMRQALAPQTAARRRRWPFVVLGVLVIGAIGAAIAVAAASNSAASSTRDAAPIATAAAHRVTVPPRRADEPPLETTLEQGLNQMAAGFEAGTYARADVVKLRCQMEIIRGVDTPPAMRGYVRRVIALLEQQQPDLDPARECGPIAGSSGRPARKIALPPALDDEPPLDEIETTTLTQMHDMLDAGQMPRAGAVTVLCSIYEARQQTKRHGASMGKTGFYRRWEMLLRGYFPDLDAAECPKQ